jgi:hypothetical protein
MEHHLMRVATGQADEDELIKVNEILFDKAIQSLVAVSSKLECVYVTRRCLWRWIVLTLHLQSLADGIQVLRRTQGAQSRKPQPYPMCPVKCSHGARKALSPYPFDPDGPELPDKNFYYVQEKSLKRYATEHGFSYIIVRYDVTTRARLLRSSLSFLKPCPHLMMVFYCAQAQFHRRSREQNTHIEFP